MKLNLNYWDFKILKKTFFRMTRFLKCWESEIFSLVYSSYVRQSFESKQKHVGNRILKLFFAFRKSLFFWTNFFLEKWPEIWSLFLFIYWRPLARGWVGHHLFLRGSSPRLIIAFHQKLWFCHFSSDMIFLLGSSKKTRKTEIR